MKNQELIQTLTQMRHTLIAVSTGGPRIGEVNHEYQQQYEEVDAALAAIGVENTNPYRDLWQWYGRWSSGDLPSYQSRRTHIAELFDSLLSSIHTGKQDAVAPPTGWPRVDRTIGKARDNLAEARNEEEFQVIGTLCREALISLAQAVFDPVRHPIDDKVEVSHTDFKRMIEAFIAVELGRGPSDELRRHARAAFDLANKLQHRRTAEFRLAAMCLEATASVVNIIAITSGRRDPNDLRNL